MEVCFGIGLGNNRVAKLSLCFILAKLLIGQREGAVYILHPPPSLDMYIQ